MYKKVLQPSVAGCGTCAALLDLRMRKSLDGSHQCNHQSNQRSHVTKRRL